VPAPGYATQWESARTPNRRREAGEGEQTTDQDPAVPPFGASCV